MIEITSPEPAETAVEAAARARALTEAGASARRLALHLVAVLTVGAALAALIGGVVAATSVVLGVGLAALNVIVMRRVLSALEGTSGLAAVWALAFPAKLVALVGAAFVLVERDIAEPVPLAIGFALLPLSGVFLPRPSSAVPELSRRASPSVPRVS